MGKTEVKKENDINLQQTEDIEPFLVKHNLKYCKAAQRLQLLKDESFPPTDEPFDVTMHQELIEGLLYLANRTRPDSLQFSLQRLIYHSLIINLKRGITF